MRILWVAAFIQEMLQALLQSKQPFSDNNKHLNSQNPDYSWGNLGYWQPEVSYAQACSQLAHRLLDDVDLNAAQSVLVLGCGYGEEVRLWAESGESTTVQSYYCVDSDAAAIEHAQNNQHITELQFTKVHWHLGDAKDYLQSLAVAQSVSFDAVCALDCAYHFSEKQRLWLSTCEQLNANGKLAISDLLLNPECKVGIINGLYLKLASIVFSIPFENWLTPKQYEASLLNSGFQRATFTMCAKEVLDGFCEFSQGPLFSKQYKKSWMLKSKITAYLISKLRKRNIIEYALITAYK